MITLDHQVYRYVSLSYSAHPLRNVITTVKLLFPWTYTKLGLKEESWRIVSLIPLLSDDFPEAPRPFKFFNGTLD